MTRPRSAAVATARARPRAAGAWRLRLRLRLAAMLVLLPACPLAQAATGGAPLPRVMSTNLCADALLLSLADPAQIVSVSRKSQDAGRSSQAGLARRFPANDGSAEEVIAARPDVVLASRRWQARHQAALFERYGIRVVTVPFPTDWQGIYASTLKIGGEIGRGEAAQARVADVQARIARMQAASTRPSALYLRPNGGTAGANTYVDAVFQAAGVRNHASDSGRKGWGRVALEEVVANPPQLFITSNLVNDGAYARGGFARHPRMQALLADRPVIRLENNDWGCSNWQLVEAAEEIAAGLRRLEQAAK